MDGVLTDFRLAYFRLTGKKLNTYTNDEKFWEPIHSSGIKFWSEMPWMSDGKTLWDFLISVCDPVILSAPSEKIESAIGKQIWVGRELPGIRLILRPAERKCELATPTSILIDDMRDNVTSWEENGGIGILYKSAENSIKQLKHILSNDKTKIRP